jgi:hypothetical protein
MHLLPNISRDSMGELLVVYETDVGAQITFSEWQTLRQ